MSKKQQPVPMAPGVAAEREHVGTDSSVIAVRGDWLVHADRESVYAIVSDFERMPKHFPKIARAMNLVERAGDVLTLEAEAASFGSLSRRSRSRLRPRCFQVEAIAAPPITLHSIPLETRNCCSSTIRRARVSTTLIL
jgi:hypothetical protein